MRVFTLKEGLWEEGGAALVCRGQGVFVEICEQKSLCKAPVWKAGYGELECCRSNASIILGYLP